MTYELVDVNPYFFNCGHYPEWEVVECDKPVDGQNVFETYEEAQARADRRNEHSARRWREYLDS